MRRSLRPAAGAAFSVFEHYAVLAPLALHTWLLAGAAFAADGLHLGVGNAVSAILWLSVLIYWLGNFHYRLDGLQSLVLPVAAVAALLPALFPSLKPLPNTGLTAFKIHLLIAMLASKGRSVLRSTYVIHRGYEDLAERLNELGANIETFRDI